MRQARLKAPASFNVAYYHCISRVVDRQFVFGDLEKEQFVGWMKEYAAFCGIQILTYCVMGNHFHLLVGVPKRPAETLTDEALLVRLERLSGMTNAGTLRQQLAAFRQQGQEGAAEVLRQRILGRLWDVSAFMKLLKQRFTQWYNRRQGRRGTLWEERFKSVLVEGAGETLATMGAYIDLNPVRANLVDDPQDYRWSGYGAVMGGVKDALEGMRVMMQGLGQGELSETEALARYRVWLHGQGEEREGIQADGRPVRRGMTREAVMQVMSERGRVAREDYLKCRVRYFVDGLVLGSRGFVDEVFVTMRERFGPQRTNGARRLKGLETGLYAMRDLRKGALG